MKTKRVIIRQAADKVNQEFWTGRKWSAEYPDAALLMPASARKAARSLQFEVGVVSDYGLVSEQWEWYNSVS